MSVCVESTGQIAERSHHFCNSHFQGLWVHFQSELQQSDIIMTSQHPTATKKQTNKKKHFRMSQCALFVGFAWGPTMSCDGTTSGN